MRGSTRCWWTADLPASDPSPVLAKSFLDTAFSVTSVSVEVGKLVWASVTDVAAARICRPSTPDSIPVLALGQLRHRQYWIAVST